jgi:hypothetical protein
MFRPKGLRIMTPDRFYHRFDLDITLRDASLDPEVRPTRRMIAAACLGMEVEDAYYSVRELRDAVGELHEGSVRGKRRLADILGNDGTDDFQRCIYYALAGKGVIEMLDDLMWLEDILEIRGRLAGLLLRSRARPMPLRDPYVAKEPDGPVGRIDADFTQGPSWYLDPTIAD